MRFAQGPGALQRAALRDTAVSVDSFILGTAPLGNLYTPVSTADAAATVAACLARGVRTFDTAPHYGLGLAERRLGAAVEGEDGDLVVITKAGRALYPAPEGWEGEPDEPFAVPPTHCRVWDFTGGGIRSTLEGSLERLGRDRVDVLLLHDPEFHAQAALQQGIPALKDLKAAGLVGAIGVGSKHLPTLARFIATGDMDVALMAGRYSLLDQGALDEVLPEAEARGTAILAAGVFNSGILARHDVPQDATFDYRGAVPRVLEKARRIAALCETFGTSLPAAAMAFPATHPRVAARVIGARCPAEVEADLGYAENEIDPGLWETLRREGLMRPDAARPALQ